MDDALISLHQKRIRLWLAGDSESKNFPIVDTCRIDNRGVIDLKSLDLPTGSGRGFVAFTPAAGASTRYFKGLREILLLPRSEAVAGLQKLALHNIPLAPKLREILQAILDKNLDIGVEEKAQIDEVLSRPKALQPCTLDLDSFLDLKMAENSLIPGLSGQVFVVPPNSVEEFSDLVARKPAALPTKIFPQGDSLSTLRFDAKGDALTINGKPSLVPAGHGMLAKLFTESRFQQTDHSLLLRNIDNIMGGVPKALAYTNTLMAFHDCLLELITAVRQQLLLNNWERAAESAAAISSLVGLSKQSTKLSSSVSLQALLTPLVGLFHTPENYIREFGLDEVSLQKTITRLYQRPLNTMGMVPNSGTDVGGTPCFVKAAGQLIKLCIEVPHATIADKKEFLENPEKATHFNPVFVAAEIPAANDYYEDPDSPFWLVAEKTFQNQAVFYHESILYELLGNSLSANSVFVAIDRANFNPHKSFTDCSNMTMAGWQLAGA